mmetsp:Transcript_70764/g.162195  ORF Transcript_70764/g.162195 Transcript_70764/m.162195 type:complete len:86 (-) Transcript_70764:250-507(-)
MLNPSSSWSLICLALFLLLFFFSATTTRLFLLLFPLCSFCFFIVIFSNISVSVCVSLFFEMTGQATIIRRPFFAIFFGQWFGCRC